MIIKFLVLENIIQHQVMILVKVKRINLQYQKQIEKVLLIKVKIHQVLKMKMILKHLIQVIIL